MTPEPVVIKSSHDISYVEQDKTLLSSINFTAAPIRRLLLPCGWLNGADIHNTAVVADVCDEDLPVNHLVYVPNRHLWSGALGSDLNNEVGTGICFLGRVVAGGVWTSGSTRDKTAAPRR